MGGGLTDPNDQLGQGTGHGQQHLALQQVRGGGVNSTLGCSARVHAGAARNACGSAPAAQPEHPRRRTAGGRTSTRSPRRARRPSWATQCSASRTRHPRSRAGWRGSPPPPKAQPAGLRPETSQGTAPCRTERQPQASDARHGGGRAARGPGRSGRKPLELPTGRLAGVAAVPAGLFRQEPTNRHGPSRNRPTGPRLPPKSSPLLPRGPFHHAAREPEFRPQMDRSTRAWSPPPAASGQSDRRPGLGAVGRPACPGGRHRGGDGLAGRRPTRPDQAADRIRQALAGVITAAQYPVTARTPGGRTPGGRTPGGRAPQSAGWSSAVRRDVWALRLRCGSGAVHRVPHARRCWCGSLCGRRQELVDGGDEAAGIGDRKAVPEADQPRPQLGQAAGRAPVLLVVR
jgi:hypothetical protein